MVRPKHLWPHASLSDTTIKKKFGLAEPKIAGAKDSFVCRALGITQECFVCFVFIENGICIKSGSCASEIMFNYGSGSSKV